jgi:hypothetical protein
MISASPTCPETADLRTFAVDIFRLRAGPYAFSRKPLSDDYRSVAGMILKSGEGGKPAY